MTKVTKQIQKTIKPEDLVIIRATDKLPTLLAGSMGIVKEVIPLANGNVCCEVLLEGDENLTPFLLFELAAGIREGIQDG